MTRLTKDCLRCGKSFTYDHWAKRLYCSRKCGSLWAREKFPVVCLHCKKQYLPKYWLAHINCRKSKGPLPPSRTEGRKYKNISLISKEAIKKEFLTHYYDNKKMLTQWRMKEGTPAWEYAVEKKYKSKSYVKFLSTEKFSQWLIDNHPEAAKRLGLINGEINEKI